jgi:hypothetical protein
MSKSTLSESIRVGARGAMGVFVCACNVRMLASTKNVMK